MGPKKFGALCACTLRTPGRSGLVIALQYVPSELQLADFFTKT
jgi:hypothetical protein